MKRVSSVMNSGQMSHARNKCNLLSFSANAVTAIANIIEIATDKAEFPDHNKRHGSKAKFGWYRYTTRFGIPVYNDEGILESYNIFRARILVRRDADGKLYLYDIVTIKKETSRPLEP